MAVWKRMYHAYFNPTNESPYFSPTNKSFLFVVVFKSLDLSYNSFTKIPVMSLTNLAALALCNLDLSHNGIVAIHTMDLSNKFRVS